MPENTLAEQLNALQSEAERTAASAASLGELSQLEQEYLSRKGNLSQLLGKLNAVPAAERPRLGQIANRAKQAITKAFAERKAALSSDTSDASDDFLLQLPGLAEPMGSRHPLMIVQQRVNDIFASMGYDILLGPDIELAKYNFDLLNIPQEHPARDIMDTFYVENRRAARGGDVPLLRTHISPMQIRVMEERKPPIRFISPGRIFRHEATDTTHEANYSYCEGLAIEKGLTLGDLMGTLETLFQKLFGAETKVRFQPSFYPFVEPGGELLMLGSKGWMEMLGCGMIHPRVLKNMRVDPREYSGFAFGLGLDRIMMYYYQIPDVRLSYRGDLRFLEQF